MVYWSYHWANNLELKNFKEFDSFYLKVENDLTFGQIRFILTVDTPLFFIFQQILILKFL